MVSPELVHALTAARRRMTQGDWQQLAARLAEMNASPDSASIRKEPPRTFESGRRVAFVRSIS